jgi:hypothetical protein
MVKMRNRGRASRRKWGEKRERKNKREWKNKRKMENEKVNFVGDVLEPKEKKFLGQKI